MDVARRLPRATSFLQPGPGWDGWMKEPWAVCRSMTNRFSSTVHVPNGLLKGNMIQLTNESGVVSTAE